MKKKWIVEAGYIAAGLFFLGICIVNGKKQGLTPSGQTGTVTPEPAPTGQSGTATPEPAPTGQSGTATPEPAPTGQAGTATPEPAPTGQAGTATPEPAEATKTPDMDIKEIKNENYAQYDNKSEAWWFVRKKDHSPSGSGEEFPIEPYSAYYRNTGVAEGDKVIYLTFDCGYENGYTPSILDTLAKENVKAMFFVTKDFVVKNPDYVKRMKEEGHLVGNHTVRHLSSPSLTPEELKAELDEVAEVTEELTGYKLDPFFRPPMGEYSQRTLKATQDMGYSSIFWSIAYYDYNAEDQPGKDYVVDHFATYHHSGAIALMHNTSESNMQALDEVIGLLKAEGYRFGQVTEFIK